jgi:two-component system sensor histidine kinase AlgZ
VAALGDLLRRVTDRSESQFIVLEEEADFLRKYLDIQQMRFAERLRYRLEIPAELMRAQVPDFILQPLVENAVKHGICNMPEGGTIRISARRAGPILQISVANPVDQDMASIRSDGHGIGLTNVRQRLAGAYKHEAGIHWGFAHNSFGVDITMPAQTSEQGE